MRRFLIKTKNITKLSCVRSFHSSSISFSRERAFNLMQNAAQTIELQNYSKAEEFLHKAYNEEHDDINLRMNILLNYASVLNTQQKPEKALQILQHAEQLVAKHKELESVYPNILIIKAVVDAHLNNTDESQRLLDMALEKDIEKKMNYTQVYMAIGICKKQQKQYDEAISYFQRAFENEKQNFQYKTFAVEHMCLIFEEMQQFDKIIEKYKELLDFAKQIFGEKSTQVISILHTISRQYLMIDQPEKALQYIKNAKELIEENDVHGTFENMRLNIEANVLHDKYEDAISICEEAIELMTKYGLFLPEIYLYLVNSYQSLGKYKEAIPLLKELLNKESGIPKEGIYERLGGLYQQINDFENSKEALIKARDILINKSAPQDHILRVEMYLAYALKKLNQLDEYEKLMQNNPNLGKAMINQSIEYAKHLMEKKEYVKAGQYFEQMLRDVDKLVSKNDQRLLPLLELLIECYVESSQFKKALPVADRFYHLCKETFGEDDQRTKQAFYNLAYISNK